MKKIHYIAILTIFSATLHAAPLYKGETLPAAGTDLPGATVVFTVPSEVSLAFSTDPVSIVDPGTVDLEISTKIEDGSFHIEHEKLYAVWNIASSKSSFNVYLYLAGPLRCDTTGKTLDWTVAGGNSTIGGADKYCTSEDFRKDCAVEIAEGKSTGYAQLTIDLNINEMIENNTISDGVYTGIICMRFEES